LKSCDIDKSVKDLFVLLTQTSSSLAKRDILIENSNNDRFTLMIDYLLNPFLVTGISEKKISKETEKQATRSFGSFPDLMDYILENNIVRDEVIANIRQF